MINPADISIAALQRAHIARQAEWCPDQKPDLSFRGNEMAGETGEACNVIKKLERERHGWRGSRDTVEHLADELADVVHTAILCAITARIDLAPYVVRKFNDTSAKNDLGTCLPLPTIPNAALERGAEALRKMYRGKDPEDEPFHLMAKTVLAAAMLSEGEQ